MSGAYCRYCGRRCFVLRLLPADAEWMPGREVHPATCRGGAANDLELIGYDHSTAVNPYSTGGPAGSEAIAAHHLALARLHGVARAFYEAPDWSAPAAVSGLGAAVAECDRTLDAVLEATQVRSIAEAATRVAARP